MGPDASLDRPWIPGPQKCHKLLLTCRFRFWVGNAADVVEGALCPPGSRPGGNTGASDFCMPSICFSSSDVHTALLCLVLRGFSQAPQSRPCHRAMTTHKARCHPPIPSNHFHNCQRAHSHKELVRSSYPQ